MISHIDDNFKKLNIAVLINHTDDMYLEVVLIKENKAKQWSAHTPLVPDIAP